MEELILFIVSIAPVLLIGWFIYRKDKEKEPWKLLLKLFVGGILSCYLASILTLILGSFFPFFFEEPENLDLIKLIPFVFIGIALVEEFSKWVFLYKMSYRSKSFDHAYDMIIYAAFVALGFAAFENLFYVHEHGVGVGLFRAVLAVPGHASDGVFMGFYLVQAKISEYKGNKKAVKKNLALSVIVPTLLHGAYDYCVFAQKDIFLLIFLAFVIVVFIFAIRKINKLSKITSKLKYKNNYCTNCGAKLTGNFCTKCGKERE